MTGETHRLTDCRRIPKPARLFALASLVSVCDSGGPTDLPLEPIRSVEFQKVLEHQIPLRPESTNFPSGVAVTPDGQWVISLGFGNSTITLYDATTLEVVAGPLHEIPCPAQLPCGDLDSFFLSQPHAAVVSPDGSTAVITSRNGVLGFSLPTLELVWLPPSINQPRYAVRDRAGRNYYFNGEEDDVERLTITDSSQAIFEADITEGIALSRDEEELFLLSDSGTRLEILGTPDLELRRSIDLPFSGVVVVPLKDAHQVIVLGGSSSGGQTSSTTPLMALPVDVVTGSVGSLQILCCENPGGLTFLFADGNQWAEVGEATAIVPTALGTVTIDTNSGIVTLHSAAELQNDIPPCCDIASYPGGDRVVITSVRNDGAHLLIVYDIEERIEDSTD